LSLREKQFIFLPCQICYYIYNVWHTCIIYNKWNIYNSALSRMCCSNYITYCLEDWRGLHIAKPIKPHINDVLMNKIFSIVHVALDFSLSYRVLITGLYISFWNGKVIFYLCKIRLSWCHGEVSIERYSVFEFGNSFECKYHYNISFGWCKGMLLVSVCIFLAFILQVIVPKSISFCKMYDFYFIF